MKEPTIPLKALENVCQRKFTPLYKKGIKEKQNKPMETTVKNAVTLLLLKLSWKQLCGFG